MISVLSSDVRKVYTPFGFGYPSFPDLPTSFDGDPQGCCDYSIKAPSRREALSYIQTESIERTLKTLRILSSVRPQEEIAPLSLLAWNIRETRFRPPRATIFLWIVATVLGLRPW